MDISKYSIIAEEDCDMAVVPYKIYKRLISKFCD